MRDMGKITVDPVGGFFPGGFVDQDLVYDFFYEIIFLIDDILLITAVYDIRKVQGVVVGNLLIQFKELDGVPARILDVWIFLM
ncbi:hypothetical protein IMSAGC020_02744 [Lachnospiraceae bacterium]|nr:hypothetical protein IMSAGC020_02744 [Lachnospiraceae bacterium]